MQTINLIKEIDTSINYKDYLTEARKLQFASATFEETKALEQINSNNMFGLIMCELMLGIVSLLFAIVVAVNFGPGSAVVICLVFAVTMAGIAYYFKKIAHKYTDFAITKVLVLRRRVEHKKHYVDIWSEEQQAYIEHIPVAGPHGRFIRKGEIVYAVRASSDHVTDHMVISISDFNFMLYQTGGNPKPLE